MTLPQGAWVRFLMLLALVMAGADGCYKSGIADDPLHSKAEGMKSMSHVRVRVIGPDGKLSDPQDVPMLVLSDAEWHKRLTPEQFRITRGKDTEPAFCGGLLHNKEAGMYVCVCCNLPLFESRAKFESGTGWPSFFQPAAAENIREKTDRSHGMARTEILCQRCGATSGMSLMTGLAHRPPLLPELRGLRFVAADQLKPLPSRCPHPAQPAAATSGEASHAARSRGGLCRGMLLVRRGGLSAARRRARRHQRLCRRHRRDGEL